MTIYDYLFSYYMKFEYNNNLVLSLVDGYLKFSFKYFLGKIPLKNNSSTLFVPLFKAILSVCDILGINLLARFNNF